MKKNLLAAIVFASLTVFSVSDITASDPASQDGQVSIMAQVRPLLPPLPADLITQDFIDAYKEFRNGEFAYTIGLFVMHEIVHGRIANNRVGYDVFERLSQTPGTYINRLLNSDMAFINAEFSNPIALIAKIKKDMEENHCYSDNDFRGVLCCVGGDIMDTKPHEIAADLALRKVIIQFVDAVIQDAPEAAELLKYPPRPPFSEDLSGRAASPASSTSPDMPEPVSSSSIARMSSLAASSSSSSAVSTAQESNEPTQPSVEALTLLPAIADDKNVNRMSREISKYRNQVGAYAEADRTSRLFHTLAAMGEDLFNGRRRSANMMDFVREIPSALILHTAIVAWSPEQQLDTIRQLFKDNSHFAVAAKIKQTMQNTTFYGSDRKLYSDHSFRLVLLYMAFEIAKGMSAALESGVAVEPTLIDVCLRFIDEVSKIPQSATALRGARRVSQEGFTIGFPELQRIGALAPVLPLDFANNINNEISAYRNGTRSVSALTQQIIAEIERVLNKKEEVRTYTREGSCAMDYYSVILDFSDSLEVVQRLCRDETSQAKVATLQSIFAKSTMDIVNDVRDALFAIEGRHDRKGLRILLLDIAQQIAICLHRIDQEGVVIPKELLEKCLQFIETVSESVLMAQPAPSMLPPPARADRVIPSRAQTLEPLSSEVTTTSAAMSSSLSSAASEVSVPQPHSLTALPPLPAVIANNGVSAEVGAYREGKGPQYAHKNSKKQGLNMLRLCVGNLLGQAMSKKVGIDRGPDAVIPDLSDRIDLIQRLDHAMYDETPTARLATVRDIFEGRTILDIANAVREQLQAIGKYSDDALRIILLHMVRPLLVCLHQTVESGIEVPAGLLEDCLKFMEEVSK